MGKLKTLIHSAFFALVLIFLYLILGIWNSLYSLNEEEKEQKKVQQKKGRVVFLPVVFFSPETSFAVGAAGMYTFYTSKGQAKSRPSNVHALLYYTLNKQYWFEVAPDVYLKNDEYHVFGTANYTKYLDKFWGIGNATQADDEEKYVSLISRLKVTVLKRVVSQLSAGLSFEYEHNKIAEVEEGGLLETGNIIGSEQGTSSGIGTLFQWDSRDNIFSSSTGYYCQFSAKFFMPALGSSYKFNMYNIDFRKYVPLFSSHVFAFQGYINIITGSPPFQMLSRLGGQDLMRGFYRGRYRDKNMVVVQMEYRLPVWWRFGLVGFVGVGDVTDNMAYFSVDTLKTCVGLGIRFRISPEEKMNVRLDIGFSKEYTGVYFSLNEAF